MIRITKPYKDDMIIPIAVSFIDGELNIDVYEEFLSVAEQYETDYVDRYFSDEALSFISENIECDGYVRYDPYNEYYIVYRTDKVCCNTDNDVVGIEDAIYEFDETEFEADVIKENAQPASLIIKDGHIAAIAAANYFIEDEEHEVELAVETLPRFRGRGYAKSVLCDMARKVLVMGKTPTYRVSCFNTASIATVKSCGFYETGKEYYYNCYKEE